MLYDDLFLVSSVLIVVLWFGIKVLELLEILQFQLPESHSEFPPELHTLKEELKVYVFPRSRYKDLA